MVLKIGVASFTLVLCSLFGLWGARASYGDPCPTGTAPALILKAPPRVAFGRATTVEFADTTAPGAAFASTTSVAITAADPSRPISRPTTQDYISVPGQSDPFVLAPGDGPALVTATWDEFGSTSCRRTASAVVQPVTGKKPTAKFDRDGGYFSAELLEPSYQTKDCEMWAPARLSLEVTNPGQRGTYVAGDPCTLTGAFGEAEKGRARGTIDGDLFKMSGYGNGGLVNLYPRGFTPAVRKFAYVVRIGTREVKRGHFWIRIRNNSDTVIYEGTDDFVNICINGNHTIRSHNRQLYCAIDGGTDREIFYRHRPKP
jgi:hypothetical protein